MGYSVYPAPATGGTNKIMFTSTASAITEVTKTLDPGYYMVSVYPAAGIGNATATATLNFFSSNGTKYTATTVDNDSSSTNNPSQQWVNLPLGAVKISVSSAAITAIIEKISEPLVIATGTITTYQTSQSITLATSAIGFLWGGGGGGGGCSNAANGGGGGGGGGGFTTFNISAGTYSLVVGGGGAFGPSPGNGGTGGTSTFNGNTATGGGGGASPQNGNSAGTGGTPNGANGSTSPSAAAFPVWITPGVAGTTGTGGNPGYGGGGCVGNGGNGGSGGSGSGSAGGAGAGGGGGANLAWTTGGAGGTGGLSVLVWS